MKNDNDVFEAMMARILNAPDTQKPDKETPVPEALAFDEMAEEMLRRAATSKVVPEAWEAILNGTLNPLSSPKYRALDLAGNNRGWRQLALRNETKWSNAKEAVEAAEAQAAKALSALTLAQDELKAEEEVMLQMRLRMLMRELAGTIMPIFALGPAWVLLRAISLVPAPPGGKLSDRARAQNEEIREKLVAYGNDGEFLEAIRAAIAAAIVEFETGNPDRVQNAEPLDEREFRSWFSIESERIFDAIRPLKPI